MAIALASSIQPATPNIRLRPDSGLIREPLGAMFPAIQRPSPDTPSCAISEAASTTPPSTRIGGSTAIITGSIIRAGLKSSIVARFHVNP